MYQIIVNTLASLFLIILFIYLAWVLPTRNAKKILVSALKRKGYEVLSVKHSVFNFGPFFGRKFSRERAFKIEVRAQGEEPMKGWALVGGFWLWMVSDNVLLDLPVKYPEDNWLQRKKNW
ncbi:hypothetical protein [Reinekea marinisedimentorum]|uniref:Uncharacterized protein n=1 Tax=Reinekea marinisedimentorum TaxID=230495 RepID=A0A4R3HQP1_9GAMM|nr:hypothetical protein [Reinekea marinisedimentorum]TCS34788.1 hypothetical protein BCF53_1391 [Reinekea marinisedimentorum]